MKSRRLTILCVMVIALVGTPRAWQEVSKLLAFAQYKAQAKFWSMVLRPSQRAESADTELIAAAQAWEIKPAGHSSGCPLERQQPRENHVPISSDATRKTDFVSPRASARRSSVSAPASHPSLVARALKAQGEENLRHTRRMAEIEAARIVENMGFDSALQKTAARPFPSASKKDNFRYVIIPSVKPVAAAFAEKDSIVEFNLLKKSFEDNRLLRPKNRFPTGRVATSFPAS